ncbi:MAG TPA: elongation factor P [Haloplasmataceae bacterium]
MISVNDLRNGMSIEMDGNIYQILEFQHVKSARSAAFVRLKVKDLRNGTVKEMTVNPNDKYKQAIIEKVSMQYLYNTGDTYVFMNNETFEQLEIPSSSLEYEKNFIREGMEVTIIMYQNEILGIDLPDKVTLQIVECEPAVAGNTATTAMKQAVLETGLTVQVPLFIENGEKIVVSTEDGRYVSRAK